MAFPAAQEAMVRVRRGCWKWMVTGLFHFDAGELDDLCVFGNFVGDKFFEIGHRHRHRLDAEIEQARLEFWIGHARGGRRIELLDRLIGRSCRRGDAISAVRRRNAAERSPLRCLPHQRGKLVVSVSLHAP